MRRLAAWIVGAAGGLVAYRLLRRQRPAPRAPRDEVAVEPDDRAEELRAKLAETRAAEQEPVAGEPVADAAAVEPDESESVEERRRQVHDEGRAALDEMQQD